MADPESEPSIARYIRIDKPPAELISPEKMRNYSNVLRTILRDRGVEKPYMGRTVGRVTPPIPLPDDTVITIERHPSPVMLDINDVEYKRAVPDARVRLSELPPNENFYQLSAEPVVCFGNQLFVYSGAHQIYRLANVDDDTVLSGLFDNLGSIIE